MTNTTRAVVLAACVAAVPAAAHASPILDQAFAPATPNLLPIFSELTRAQTFTVGQAGLLSRVEVLLATAAGLPARAWPFQVIRTNDAGVPVYGTAPLASFTITLPANSGTVVAGFYGADVAAGLIVAPGDVLAIVSVGTTPLDMSHWWVGQSMAPYTRGAYFTEFFDVSGKPDGVLHQQDTSDLGFRTFVDGGEQDPDPDPEPIPEPGTLVLFGAGLMALRWARGGRRAGRGR